MRFFASALLVCLFVLPVYAQQPPPSCEDRLAHAQAQLDLLTAGRSQGEFLAADALAALRKRVAQLEADLQKQHIDQAAAQPPAKKK